MVYTSLASSSLAKAPLALRIAHLYGDLMNTYGDNGNVLMMKYVAEKLGATVRVDIVSLGDAFNQDDYDIVFFGGGQDYEQAIVAADLPQKKDDLATFIENNGVVLAICGGFQLLGQYYIEANGRKIDGAGILNHYTLNQKNNRYIGNCKIYNEEFNETYCGFENHQGRTFLSEKEAPLGKVTYGTGNHHEDQVEGLHYKNVFASYFHGPLLCKNPHLAYRLVTIALNNRYGKDLALASYHESLPYEHIDEYQDIKEKANVQ